MGPDLRSVGLLRCKSYGILLRDFRPREQSRSQGRNGDLNCGYREFVGEFEMLLTLTVLRGSNLAVAN